MFISYGIYSRKIKTKNRVYIEPAHKQTCTLSVVDLCDQMPNMVRSTIAKATIANTARDLRVGWLIRKV